MNTTLAAADLSSVFGASFVVLLAIMVLALAFFTIAAPLYIYAIHKNVKEMTKIIKQYKQ